MKLKSTQCEGKIRFYCYYCDHDITPASEEIMGATYDCNYCTYPTKFICSGYVTNPDIEYILFYINGHAVELDICREKTILFGKYPESGRMLALNYLINIRPANADYWLDKLLNLTVFS